MPVGLFRRIVDVKNKVVPVDANGCVIQERFFQLVSKGGITNNFTYDYESRQTKAVNNDTRALFGTDTFAVNGVSEHRP